MSSRTALDGELIAIGAQAALCDDGKVATADIEKQIALVIDRIAVALDIVGASLGDLVKLVAFYTGEVDASEAEVREMLSAALPNNVTTVLTCVAVRELCGPEALIEIEAFAISNPDRQCVSPKSMSSPGKRFCHGLRCGELVFVGGQTARNQMSHLLFSGDLVAQNRLALDNIELVLGELGADKSDIVKANTWRAPPPSDNQYRQAARDRFAFFESASPALTGITVPATGNENPLITIDTWAIRGRDGQVLPRQHINPLNHWDWSSPTTYSHGLQCNEYLFVGGQAALDTLGEVLEPGDMAAQTRITMDYIGNVLRATGLSFDDVFKVKTLFTGAPNPTNLEQCTAVIREYTAGSEVASSAIPVDELAYPGQVVEIEVIARDRAFT